MKAGSPASCKGLCRVDASEHKSIAIWCPVGRVAAFEESGFVFIDDVTSSRVQRCLADLRLTGVAEQTFNFYLSASKQVCRWLVLNRRASENPQNALMGGNVKPDVGGLLRQVDSDDLRLSVKRHKSDAHSTEADGLDPAISTP